MKPHTPFFSFCLIFFLPLLQSSHFFIFISPLLPWNRNGLSNDTRSIFPNIKQSVTKPVTLQIMLCEMGAFPYFDNPQYIKKNCQKRRWTQESRQPSKKCCSFLLLVLLSMIPLPSHDSKNSNNVYSEIKNYTDWF